MTSNPRKLARHGLNFIRNRVVNRAVILLYHRVNELPSDPCALCLPNAIFDEQMAVLKNDFNPISLSEMVTALDKGKLPDRAVAVTFDDGYLDNLTNAAPILTRHDVPATVFVATGFIDSPREFYWDALDRIFLQPGRLPPVLDIRIRDRDFRWELGPDSDYSPETAQLHHNWSLLRADSPTRRHVIYRELCGLLRTKPKEQRMLRIDELFAWAGLSNQIRPTHKTMNDQQVRQFAAIPGMTIGAHTVTHSCLAELPLDRQREEIVDSKRHLERLTNKTIDLFAYPFGADWAFDLHTINAVQKAGFHAAVSAKSGLVWSGVNHFAIPRFVMHNWHGPDFLKRLQLYFMAG